MSNTELSNFEFIRGMVDKIESAQDDLQKIEPRSISLAHVEDIRRSIASLSLAQKMLESQVRALLSRPIF